MAGFSQRGNGERVPPSIPRVATLPPRVEGHSGFQLSASRAAAVPLPRAAAVPPPLPRAAAVPLPRAAAVPPPLPRAAARPSGAMFSAARRSQPPPRKRRSEPRTTTQLRSSRSSCTQVLNEEQFGDRCFSSDPGLSHLAVANDVLSESLRPPALPSLSARLEQRAAAWFPTFERWQLDALAWLAERAAWQRCAIAAAMGAVLGLGIVFTGALVLRTGVARVEVQAAALAPHAVPRAVVQAIAPVPASVAVAPAVVLNAQPRIEEASHEPLLEEVSPEPERAKRALKHKKRVRARRAASSDIFSGLVQSRRAALKARQASASTR